MAGRTRIVVFLSAWGLFALVGGFLLFDPTSYSPESLTGGLRWLIVLVTTILGGGLILSGIRVWQDGLQYARRMRLPALILAVIGLVIAVGNIPVLRPWEYSGLGAGISGMGVIVFLVGGGVGVAAGLRYYRRRNPYIPLTLLAGLTGSGAFFPLNNAGLLNEVHELGWVALLILFIGGPVIGMFYGWPTLLVPESVAEGGGT